MAIMDSLMEKPTVLIVEDSADDLALLSGLLKDLCTVKIAINGERALKVIRTGKPPDLILLDIMMPVMDGYETCRHLKQSPETMNIPVIFLTSKSEPEDEMKGFELGAVDYITKPISPPIVLARVQTHLQLKRVRDYLKDKNAFLEDEVNRRTQMITHAKQEWERTFDAVPDLIMLLDTDHRILRANRAMAEPFGKTCQELVGCHCYEVVHGLSAPPDICPHTRLLDSMKEERTEFMEEGLGLFLDVRTTPLYREDGQLKGSLHVVRDITKQKEAEHQVKERIKELQAFFTLSELITREGTTIEELCQEFCNVLPQSWQYPEITCARIVIGETEFCTNNYKESEWMQSAPIKVKGAEKGRIDVGYLEERPALDEGPFMKEERLLINALAERLGHIIGRRQTEDALRMSEILNRRLVEHLPHRVFVKDRNSVFVSCNMNYARDLGTTPEQIIGKNIFDFQPAELAEAYHADDQAVIKTGQMKDIEERFILAGQERWIHTLKVPFCDDKGNITGVLGVYEDITDIKKAAGALRKSEEYFRAIIENASDIILVVDKKGRISFASPSIEQTLGYKPEEMIGKSSLDLIAPADVPRAIQDFGNAISAKGTLVQNAFRVRHKDGSERMLEGVARNLFKNPSVAGFIMNVHDVTDRKRAEEHLQVTLESLRKAVGTTIQVISSTVEARDPYTAGHQIRSANLARIIATEMGLPPEKIEGIRMAGSIHDIGKISIPSEILTKPTRLTDLEFAMIKEHAQRGYELLKNVESPWPLAEIVHQHHEKMDGSGYPRNLKGEEILIEARILAVADVVEAMASHRPYRPGLGIDVALNEIERNRGIFYDDAVADTCLRLFREKGFQLAST